jgi:pyruvate-formate lyase-activating enzyme
MSSKLGDEFVFDSSAFINGAHHHYFLDTMRPVWDLVEAAIDDQRVVVIRAVYREVLEQDDEISKLVARHAEAIAEPTEQVQRRAGEFERFFSHSKLRDQADPWVMAEAEAREAVVVTYEGITFSGEPARGADKKLPAICKNVGLDCCTLAQALRDLGLKLG